MGEGVHGRLAGTNGPSQPRLRDAGFRVVIGDLDEARDVTDLASGLRYSSRLPGGYADCSFSLHMPLADAVTFLTHLNDLQVFYDGQLAWEGRIEEPPRGSYGSEALPVNALGRGARLKRQKFTKLFVTSGYDRWRGAQELVANQPAASDLQSFVGYPPDANANPGFVFGYPNGATIQVADDVAWIWAAPPGCSILRVAGSINAQGTSGALTSRLYTMSALAGYGGTTLETVVASRALSAGDTTFDVTLSNTGATYLRFESEFTSGAPVTISSPEFWHYHSMKIVGARTVAGAVFDPAQVTTYGVIRALLSEFGGSVVQSSDEMMQIRAILPSFIPGASLTPTFAWPDLIFDQPTTVEEAINRVNAVVGWEWGVFENGLFYYGPIHTITTLGRDSTFGDGSGSGYLAAFPTWWLMGLAADGHRVVLNESITDVVNEVYVYYTDAAGLDGVSYSSDFTNTDNPLNQRDGSGPKETQTGTVSIPGTCDSTTAASIATAYLAQYSRPQVKGEITWNGLEAPKVRVGATTSQGEVMPTPLIRPGHWVQVPDAVGMRDSSRSPVANPRSSGVVGVPIDLLPIRSVEVDADTGSVTCTVDSSRDVLGVMLAQLTAAAA